MDSFLQKGFVTLNLPFSLGSKVKGLGPKNESKHCRKREEKATLNPNEERIVNVLKTKNRRKNKHHHRKGSSNKGVGERK